MYNQRFSKVTDGQRHPYSVPLIPDIALRVPDGPNAGLHLFDAKFPVQALADVGLAADDQDANDEKAAERAGSFKRADIYKMHAYRDAIPDARSVWTCNYRDRHGGRLTVPHGIGPPATLRRREARDCTNRSNGGWSAPLPVRFPEFSCLVHQYRPKISQHRPSDVVIHALSGR